MIGNTTQSAAAASRDAGETLRVIDLGRTTYQAADDVQRREHAAVVAGALPALIVFEPDPVITVSRRKSAPQHLLASKERLAQLGIDVQPTDRGGDITYHGPGQIVAYPILRLADYGVNVGRYMRFLETVIIDTVAAFGVRAFRDEEHTGVWVDDSARGPGIATSGRPASSKLAAIGVRVSRGVTLHGLALNVSTDLSHFDTIVPCGISGRGVTSLQRLVSPSPQREDVSRVLVTTINETLRERARSSESLTS